MICMLCPRRCGIDRKEKRGYCGAPLYPHVARADLHMWEEPCLSGQKGAGTIFFCGCNLDCIFCQNHAINHSAVGPELDAAALAALMLHLQDLGAHNIDLVTPTPHLHVIRPALEQAKASGLHIPVIYNTNGYELVASLRSLEGLVDIYLPDLKYVSRAAGEKYSDAADYFSYAGPAMLEMYRQCGSLTLDDDGIAIKGLLVRHLVLPGSVDETRGALDFIADNLPLDTQLSLMSQYVPCHLAINPPLNRKLTYREYERAVNHCLARGFTRVYIQELDAAQETYTPCFDGKIR